MHAYRSQFKKSIELAEENPEKTVVFKPTTPGLGVFGNDVESIAKAFYIASKEYEALLRDSRVKVCLQVFRGEGYARQMANVLGLEQSSL